MISEPLAAVPAEVTSQIEQLQAEIETLQRELGQARDVWRGTLEVEKKQFEEFVQHKTLAWQEQETQWLRQKLAYEQRIEELKTEFEARLKQTEQNAVRSLNELDDAWQRDKLDWGAKSAPPAIAAAPVASPQLDTLRQQLVDLQDQMATAQSKSAQSDNLVDACLQALDHQIEVLYDLMTHFSSTTPPNPEPSLADR